MMEMFSVHDMAANRFIDPFPALTIDTALRGFKEACMTEGHQFAKFPEDYALYHIGSFDPQNAALTPIVLHKVGMASSFTRPFGNQLELEPNTSDHNPVKGDAA